MRKQFKCVHPYSWIGQILDYVRNKDFVNAKAFRKVTGGVKLNQPMFSCRHIAECTYPCVRKM